MRYRSTGRRLAPPLRSRCDGRSQNALFLPRGWLQKMSALVVVGAVLVSAVILGASVLRIVAVGPLFTAGALPMLWFLWVGIRLAHGP
jgi:hypothetical protein